MNKGCIYYTNNKVEEPIFSVVQKRILKAELPIVSCSLKPIDFGENIVLDLQPSAMTLFIQIVTALEASTSDIIFFCENDVLYHQTHFEFVPPSDNIFYYNTNVWRWDYPKDRAITYDRLVSLSGLCSGRDYLVNHYRKRIEIIKENKFKDERDPHWARKMGYEPGTKSKKRGGSFDDIFEEWRSPYPNIDIRHDKTHTPRKVDLNTFKHQPTNFRETTLDKIEGWNLKELL